MKIGIMSMQRVKNYGSFLQAYSLKNTLEALGHDVEFVDFDADLSTPQSSAINIQTFFKRALGFVYIRLFKSGRQKRQRYMSQKDFMKRYEAEFFPILGIGKDKNFYPELDTLIIGSDEVFNCLQTPRLQAYSKALFGKDNNAKRLISYAASFGSTTLEGLKEHGIADEVADMLREFDAISVRDLPSGEIVKTLTGKTPLYHLDPVFLYDYTKLMPESTELHDYIVVYAYDGRITKKEAKQIKSFAQKQGKKTVTVGMVQDFCDIYVPASPFELLCIIKNADFVVTDTFHGTVFSIKYNKQFVSIIRDSNKQKLGDLLDRFDLKSRSLKSVSDLESTLLTPINFESANKMISEQTTLARTYLKDNI